MSTLPNTRRRLATSVSIYAVANNIAASSLTTADGVAALAKGAIKIGSIRKFTEENTRETVVTYELDSDNPGEISERVPSLVDRNLTIERAELYQSDVMVAFGGASMHDLIDQRAPFTIMKVEKAPAESGIATRTTIYTGCWFESNPKNYEMSGDLLIIQSVAIGYERKIVV